MRNAPTEGLAMAALAAACIAGILLVTPGKASESPAKAPEQTDSVVIDLPACEDVQSTPTVSCLMYDDLGLGQGPQTYYYRSANQLVGPTDVRDLPSNVHVQLAG